MDTVSVPGPEALQQRSPGIQAMPSAPVPVLRRSGGRGKLVVILVVILVLLCGGYAGAAFYFKLWPFQSGGQLDKQLAFANIFSKILEVQSGSYELTADAQVEPRTPGLSSFDLTFPELESERQLYERDADRYRSLNDILGRLHSYYQTYKRYPQRVDDLAAPSGLPGVDSGPRFDGVYTVIADGADFALRLTFETEDAVRTVRPQGQETSSTIEINGKTVTFHKESAQGFPYFYFNAVPKRPSWISVIENQDTWLGFVPSDFKGQLIFGGTMQRHEGAKSDTEFHLGVEWNFGDLTAAADGEMRKKGEDFYGRINKFPSLGFFDVSKIKGQWVKITTEDLIGAGSGFSSWSLDFTESSNEKFAAVRDQLQTAFRLMGEEKALIVDFAQPDQTIAERPAYVYKISLDETKVASWYERLAKELTAKYGPEAIIKLDEATIKVLRSESFQRYLAYVKKTNDFYIFVDSQTGFPVRFDYRSIYVPSEKTQNLKDKQLAWNIRLEWRNINQPVNVEVPTPHLTFEEAYLLWTGQSKEVYRFKKQASTVEAIRKALGQYRERGGVYPQTLSQLMTPRKDIFKQQTYRGWRDHLRAIFGLGAAKAQVSIDFPSNFAGLSDTGLLEEENAFYEQQKEEAERKLEESPFMRIVPNDVFTGAPYGYQGTGSEYQLTYQMQLPPRQKQGSGDDFLSYTNQVSINESIKYVQGLNTATRLQLSKEAEESVKKDSDADKLPDRIEVYYGSDMLKKDSDGDGYSDYDEVQKGYDPAGPGQLPYGDRWYVPYQQQAAVPTKRPLSSDATKVLALMQGTLAGAVLCQDGGKELQATIPAVAACSGKNGPQEGKPLCLNDSSIGTWPELPSNYGYSICTSNSANGTFSYTATNGACGITCTESGCTAVDYCDL